MFHIEEEIKKLPSSPGVYLMKDENNRIIYVGKAISLKNRVRQYFNQSKNHSLKVRKMVQHICSFEYIVTQSEMEALVLECNLIKKYNPKYNIRLKDDKQYPYIKITIKDDFPKVMVVRQMKKDGNRYFGPYTDGQAMWELMDIIKKTWTLRTCNRVLPRDIGKERACLNYDIGQCSAPCQGKITKEKYRQMIEEVSSFLSGKYKDTVKKLEKEMLENASNMQFEKAAVLRDQIRAIKKVEEKQNVEVATLENQDIIAFAKTTEETLVQVYFVRNGKLVGREHFYFKDTEEEKIETIFRDFLLQFYGDATFIPKEIVIEREPEEMQMLMEYLSNKKGSKVTVFVPQKGVKHGLLELASKNADITLAQFGEHLKREQQKTKKALEQLQHLLNLVSMPKRIEAYDISNTQGVQSVGGMVVFEEGKPKRSDYRKFKIQSIVGPNDYGSLEEVIQRRIERLVSEKEEGSFAKRPDLILVDGGKGQVHSVQRVLDRYSITIPVSGMIKDDRHRTKGLIYKEEEVKLVAGSEAFQFITRVQDEVHRFSIEYHKTLRGKAQVQSILDEIKGVGQTRKRLLLTHFKGIEGIKSASVEELQQVKGIPKHIAQTIYQFFHPYEIENE